MTDYFGGIVVGAAAAAIGAVLAYKLIGSSATPEPYQLQAYSPTARDRVVVVEVPRVNDPFAAPVVQNTPITEAAYNQQMTDHQPAFGRNANRPYEEAVFPA